MNGQFAPYVTRYIKAVMHRNNFITPFFFTVKELILCTSFDYVLFDLFYMLFFKKNTLKYIFFTEVYIVSV